jgi:hypothetical protein
MLEFLYRFGQILSSIACASRLIVTVRCSKCAFPVRRQIRPLTEITYAGNLSIALVGDSLYHLMRLTVAVSLCGLLTACAVPGDQRMTSVEQVYVVRSQRISRNPASPFCAAERTGFTKARSEDHFNFQSIALDTQTGTVTDPHVRTVGALRACFGPTEDPNLITFYGEGALGNVTFRGWGECRIWKRNHPEPGANISRCFLDLSDLPTGYVGGHLTSNTLTTPKQMIGLRQTRRVTCSHPSPRYVYGNTGNRTECRQRA